MKNVLLAILFLGVSFSLLAQKQDTTKKKIPNYNLRFSVFPGHNYRIKIDGVLMPPHNQYEVTKGAHKVSIWSPNYTQCDTTIVVGEEKVIVRKRLKPTQALLEYKAGMEVIKRRSRVMVASSIGIGFFGTMTYLTNNRLGKDNLERIKAQNSVDYKTLDYNRDDLSELNDKHQTSRNFRNFYAIGLGLCTANLVRQIIKYRKVRRPKLKKDKSFVLDGSVMLYPKGNIQSTITLKF